MNKIIIMVIALTILGTEFTFGSSITAVANSTDTSKLSIDNNMTLSSTANFNITYNKTSYVLRPYVVIDGRTTFIDSADVLTSSQLTYQPRIIKEENGYKFAYNFSLISRLTETGFAYKGLKHTKTALYNKDILINFGDLIQNNYKVSINDTYVKITGFRVGINDIDPYVSFTSGGGGYFSVVANPPYCESYYDIMANGSNSAIFVYVQTINDFNNADYVFIDNVTWGDELLTKIDGTQVSSLENFIYYKTLGTQTENSQYVTICFHSPFDDQILYGNSEAITLRDVNQTNPYLKFRDNTSTGTLAYLNVTGTNSSNMILDSIVVFYPSGTAPTITKDSQQNTIYTTKYVGTTGQYGRTYGSWKDASNFSTMTNYTLSNSRDWAMLSVEVNGFISPVIPPFIPTLYNCTNNYLDIGNFTRKLLPYRLPYVVICSNALEGLILKPI